MTRHPIVYIEHVCHDPVVGKLTGTAVRRRAGGLVRRRICVRAQDPIMTHDEAVRRLYVAAETSGRP